MDIQSAFQDAYARYLQALEDAWKPADVQERVETAYRVYNEMLSEASQSAVQQQVSDAWRRYAGAVEDALTREGIQERAAEAYQSYVRTIVDAWRQAEPAALDSQALAAIGQSMIAAAWMAAASEGKASSSSTPNA